MTGMGKVISTLLVIDTFFISFAVGFNSRKVDVVDPTLPPLVQPAAPAKSTEPAKAPIKDKKSEHSPATEGAASAHKKHTPGKTKHSKKH